MLNVGRGYLYSLCLSASLLVAVAGGANAQQVFGSIIGTITDPSGSAVANAKVTITDTAKGTSFDVMTNDAGQYTKGQLIPDPYTVTIEASGFQKAVSNELTVQVDQATQFNATLQVGNVSQQVEVTAAAPLLQTDRADVAQTFTARELSELPSIGRNLQAFELLNPGTVKLAWQHASDENPQGSVQTEVNGQLFDSTGYYLDGTVNQDPILGIIVVNPTFDSVNEVKQANQDYDAEFGYTGAGLLLYSTKSGTNQFHGDVFDYMYLNTPGFQDFGRDPFSQNVVLPGGVYTPTTHQNQFGGSLGGKIIKDKLFYFADAQVSINHTGGSALTSVPTAQDRTGNLSDWLALGSQYQIYDPYSGNQSNGTGRAPYAGDIIPAFRLSPQALAIMNYFPLPNTAQSIVNGVVAPYNNYSGSGVIVNDAQQWNTRWDYYLSQKDVVFGRFSYANFSLGGPGVFGAEAGGPGLTGLTTSGGALRYAGQSTSRDYSIAAGWTHTSSATLVNELRFGYVKYHVNDDPDGYGTTPATAAGIPGFNTSAITSGMPYFEIELPGYNGSCPTGGGATCYQLGYDLADNGCNCPLIETDQQYQFVDNVSKIVGNHNFKFGADVRYALNLRVPSDNHRAGEVYFNDSNTGLINSAGGSVVNGNGFASFLLGEPEQFQRYVSTSTDAMEHQKRMFWYGQDEWHVNQKLTFTYGVRWEMVFPETVNAPGNGAELNINTGQMDVFGIGLVSSHGYQSMNWHEFAPRVSVAYQVTPKTVVRAGYGWTYSLGTFGSTFGHNVTQNVPVLAHQIVNQGSTCGNNFCDVFTLSAAGNGLAVGAPAYSPGVLVPNASGVFTLPGSGPDAVESKTRPNIMTMPTFYLFNFTVQHQVTNKVSVQGAYVGNQGRHTPLGTDMSFNMNQNEFVPGIAAPGVYPFDGGLGTRYNYGWTQAIDNYCNCANNEYNSFQGIVKVTPTGGYTLTGNYTYQVAEGDGWGGNESYTFLYDRPLGWGNNPEMPHQQITLSQTWNIPFGRGRHWGANTNRFIDGVFGGWNLSGITSIYSGIPFMPTIDNYGTNVQPYTGPNNRPNVGTGAVYAANPNRNQWIVGCPNQVCTSGPYLFPASNTFGNYPVNTLYGPWFYDQDVSLMKQFSISERFKFTLRSDARNMFNHTNLGLPNADVESPSVGQITSTAFGGGNMRLLQYSGTISW